jgi:hypothetical protein
MNKEVVIQKRSEVWTQGRKTKKSCFQWCVPLIIKKSHKYDDQQVLLLSANIMGFVYYFEAHASPIEEV